MSYNEIVKDEEIKRRSKKELTMKLIKYLKPYKFKSLIKDEMTTIDEIFYDVDEQCKESFGANNLSTDGDGLLAQDEAASALE